MAEFTHPQQIAAPLAFVLFQQPEVDLTGLQAALTEELGDGVSTFTTGGGESGRPETPTLAIQANGVTVLLAAAGVPVPDGQALAACHPAWWTDTSPVADHRSHAVLTVYREPGIPVDREMMLNEAVSLSLVATVALEQDGAVALLSGNAGATYPAAAYHDLVVDSLDAGQLPIEAWVSAWLSVEDDGVSGYTVGLDSFGHADLLVQDSARQPSEVYAMLLSLARHLITTGEFLAPDGHVRTGEDEFALSPVHSDIHEGWLLRIAF